MSASGYLCLRATGACKKSAQSTPVSLSRIQSQAGTILKLGTQPSSQQKQLDEFWNPAKHIKAGTAYRLVARKHGIG